MTERRLFVTYLLASLLAGENHGYGIYKKMADDSMGTIFVYDRAVYRELPRLVQIGLIESAQSDSKQVKYRLTSRGRRWLQVERGSIQIIEQLLRERL